MKVSFSLKDVGGGKYEIHNDYRKKCIGTIEKWISPDGKKEKFKYCGSDSGSGGFWDEPLEAVFFRVISLVSTEIARDKYGIKK